MAPAGLGAPLELPARRGTVPVAEVHGRGVEVVADGGEAEGEDQGHRDRHGEGGGDLQPREHNEEDGAGDGGGRVDLLAQHERDLGAQDVAHCAARGAGHHAHDDHYGGGDAEKLRRLGAGYGEEREAEGVGDEERAVRGPEEPGVDEDRGGGREDGEEVGGVGDSEHRPVEEHIT